MFSGAFKEKKKIPAAMYIIILFLNHIMLFSTVSGAFLPPHTTSIIPRGKFLMFTNCKKEYQSVFFKSLFNLNELNSTVTINYVIFRSHILSNAKHIFFFYQVS